jgi:uncharacterized protein YyaL (SSP411 family)
MHGRPDAGPRNRLAEETSPYLLQHAANPVDWFPWGDEAIDRARRLDRPILLSIGYSACHWCHVMAHESFEDEATAEVMNRLFVNVKLDREERPDLDKVYQLAHQLLTQRGGGWPLTVFLAPDDLTPFFAGTYFPKEPRYGMPAFVDVLRRVEAFYRQERAGVRSQNAALRGVFAEIEPDSPDADTVLSREPIAAALRQLAASFDPRFGGFGPAPKFPHASSLELLLREPDADSRSMALVTLRRMAEGGIFDQLGGGFCRYSVDPFWMIPHFEKMLYDNGPLLALCAQGAVLAGDGILREAALATASWALGEMRAPGGAFFAALDADSEGHEGRYYVWQRDEVRALLTPEEYRVFERRYGLDRDPNFEGAWHLHAFVALEDLAREMQMPGERAKALLDAARAKLLAARGRRVRPGLDDKILAGWNALMIRGLAIAGRLLDEPRLVDAAIAAVDFLGREAWRDGRLHAAWKDGAARFPARRAARGHAVALSRRGPRLRRPGRRRAAGWLHRPRARRILVHRRGRGHAPRPPQGLRRRVHGIRKRRRRAGARAPRLADGRGALSRCGRRGRARCLAVDGPRAAGARRHAERARRAARSGRDRNHPRRGGRRRRLAAEALVPV